MNNYKSLIAILGIFVAVRMLTSNVLGTISMMAIDKLQGIQPQSLSSPVTTVSTSGGILSHIIFAVVVLVLLQWSGLWVYAQSLSVKLINFIESVQHLANPVDTRSIANKIDGQDRQLQAQINEKAEELEEFKEQVRLMVSEQSWGKARAHVKI